MKKLKYPQSRLPRVLWLCYEKVAKVFGSRNRMNHQQKKLRVWKAPENREMVYAYQPSERDCTVVLLHGLGQDLFSLDDIANRLEKDGYGLLRIDLYGHGQTLQRELQKNDGKIPASLPFENNVNDIIMLIKGLKLSSISLIGHSYGGGIALKISELLPKDLVKSIHILAPYLQRLDKFYAEHMDTQDLILKSAEKSLQFAGFSERQIRDLIRPWEKISNPFFMESDQLQSSSWSLAYDRMMDPFVEKYMEKTFRKFFLNKMRRNDLNLQPEERTQLEIKVKTAILATKGIRNLDYLDRTRPLESFPDVLQIFSGEKDQLIGPRIVQQFIRRLEDEDIPFEHERMTGPQSHHYFPQAMSEEIYLLIMKKLDSKKAKLTSEARGKKLNVQPIP